jgi:hypothetical protein
MIMLSHPIIEHDIRSPLTAYYDYQTNKFTRGLSMFLHWLFSAISSLSIYIYILQTV